MKVDFTAVVNECKQTILVFIVIADTRQSQTGVLNVRAHSYITRHCCELVSHAAGSGNDHMFSASAVFAICIIFISFNWRKS